MHLLCLLVFHAPFILLIVSFLLVILLLPVFVCAYRKHRPRVKTFKQLSAHRLHVGSDAQSEMTVDKNDSHYVEVPPHNRRGSSARTPRRLRVTQNSLADKLE